MNRTTHVVLLEPEIPWNTGNAGRSCLAAGAQLHLVEPLGFSMDAKQVRRAGLDYWEQVSVKVWPAWSRFEAEIPSLGEPYYLSAEAERTIWDVDFADRSVLVFGKETAGLPDEIREANRDRLCAIPMQNGSVRSLNVSTAIGIVLFEVLRQRRTAR